MSQNFYIGYSLKFILKLDRHTTTTSLTSV